MNRRVSHLIAGWRTGLPRPVLILQAGNALNYFGYGLILPFEIIYLHQTMRLALGVSFCPSSMRLDSHMRNSSSRRQRPRKPKRRQDVLAE